MKLGVWIYDQGPQVKFEYGFSPMIFATVMALFRLRMLPFRGFRMITLVSDRGLEPNLVCVFVTGAHRSSSNMGSVR